MRKFVIESVVKTRPWINGIQVHLDDPAAAMFASPHYGLSLRGWAVCAGEQIANISLGWYGKRIANAKMFARGDVEAACPGNRHVVGFCIDAVPAVLGESEPLKIILDTTDNRSTTVFEITLRFIADTQAPPSDATTTFAPIIASARSGATFLSQLLHAHEEVFRHREHPSEARFGIRLAEEWFENMQPCFYEPEGSRNGQSMDQNLLAALAVLDNEDAANCAWLSDYFATLRQQYRQRIMDLYKMLSTSRAASASVIIEKLDLQWDLDLIGGLFERVRPVFIVRDPRDMLVSMRAFNAQSGRYEFHEAHGKDFGSLLPVMAGNLMHLACLYDRYPGEKLLISYEELAIEPAATLHRVLSFIGIDNSADTIAQLLQTSAVQGGPTTTSSPASSIERWREALTLSEAQMTNWFFEPFLRRFGYAE
jgi:Sulfotransferase family